MDDTARSKRDSALTVLSQSFRRRMTRKEKHLWYDYLKGSPQTVKRQEAIGNYIVDFYCADARLVIELDGSQHYSETGLEKDRTRDEHLRSLGIKVLRYSNYDVNSNFEGVCMDINKHLKERCWREYPEKEM